jgi:hypothetical protein
MGTGDVNTGGAHFLGFWLVFLLHCYLIVVVNYCYVYLI